MTQTLRLKNKALLSRFFIIFLHKAKILLCQCVNFYKAFSLTTAEVHKLDFHHSKENSKNVFLLKSKCAQSDSKIPLQKAPTLF